MKKWIIIRNITLIIIGLYIINNILLLIWNYLNRNINHCEPCLGIDCCSFIDYYMIDVVLGLTLFSIPLIISVVLLIISIIKIKTQIR